MNWAALASGLQTLALIWLGLMILAVVGNWILQSKGNKLKKGQIKQVRR